MVQGTSRLVLRTESLGRFERHRLASFADQIEANQAVVSFEVTAASGARARAAGWTAPQLIGWLGQRLGRPVPDGLVVTIRGWLADLPAARQAVMRLVKLPDPIVWTTLAPLTEAGVLLLRVAPTLVLTDEAGLARIGQALTERGIALEASLLETVVAGWSAEGTTGSTVGLDLSGLQPLRGKALRDFLAGPIADGRRVVLLHQAPNQKAPKRHSVLPTRIEHRYMGYYLIAETPQQTMRSFKLDDVLAVAIEEGR
jgi:hypothetical protein